MNRRESLTPTAPGMDPKSVVLPLDEGAQVVAAQSVARQENGRETPRSGDGSGDGFLRRAWNVATYPARWLRWRVQVWRLTRQVDAAWARAYAAFLAEVDEGAPPDVQAHIAHGKLAFKLMELGAARPTLWGAP